MKQYLALFLAAFFAAMASILVRFTSGIDVFLITLFVMFFASVFFFIITKILREEVRLKNTKTLIVFGLSQLGTWSFLYAALLVSPISTTMFLFYTAPIFALIMSPLILKEKIHILSVVAIIIALGGVALILNPAELTQFFASQIGFAAALLAAFSYGLNTVLGRLLRESHKPIPLSFFAHFIGFLFLLVLIPFLSNFQNITLSNISILLLMGLLSGSAYALFYYGLRKLIAQKGATIMLMEPVFATLLAILLFTEAPTLFTLIGGILILLAAVLTNYSAE